MSLANLATRPVTYHRYSTSGEDPYGNPTETWTADGSATYVSLQQTDATEVTVNGDVQVSDWRLVDPNPAAGLSGRDKVEVDGVMYQVVGPPQIAWTPRGPHHLEARLRCVDPQ